MEQQPIFQPVHDEEQVTRREQSLGFVKRLGRVLMFSLVGSVLYALIFGPRSVGGFADGLFIAGAILLLVAISPLVGEIIGRASLPMRLEDQSLEDAMQEERRRRRQSETITYLFGVGGIIVVALSFIISLYSR